jgi:hypothetical protein
VKKFIFVIFSKSTAGAVLPAAGSAAPGLEIAGAAREKTLTRQRHYR